VFLIFDLHVGNASHFNFLRLCVRAAHVLPNRTSSVRMSSKCSFVSNVAALSCFFWHTIISNHEDPSSFCAIELLHQLALHQQSPPLLQWHLNVVGWDSPAAVGQASVIITWLVQEAAQIRPASNCF
jgi:hypothetical protein